MSTALVIGAGPGIGRSVARRFARERFSVGVLARTVGTVDDTVAALADFEVPTAGVTADVSDEAGLRVALDKLVADVGVPDVLVYNVGLIQADSIGELSTAQHLAAWAVNVVGAITAAAHVVPAMARSGGGTVVLTGGMPAAVPQYASLSLGKAGVRTLTELLDAQFGPMGVHVATVTVGGTVAPGSPFDPDEIAEVYWDLHREHRPGWRREVRYDGRV